MKNKEITDSIYYAADSGITLPPDSHVERLPRIHSFYTSERYCKGDFYWVEEWGGKY